MSVVRGPDGNMWFTAPQLDSLGRITPQGQITLFSASNASGPESLVVGPDKALWFTEDDGDRVGRITTDGRLREFQSGISPGANPSRITSGPDGALWFTELDNDRIARVTLTGRITEYFVGRGSRPWGITSGPDKRIWFAAGAGNQVVRFTPPDLPGVAGTLTYDYAFTGSRTRFTSMRVAGLPRGTRLTARCRGGGCPRGTFVRRNERWANLSKRFRSPLAPGARIEVRVTRSGESPKLFLFRINRAGTKPTFKVRCRPKGAKSPRRCVR